MLDIRFVFTNEVPFLIENLTPAIYIRITKFIFKNEMNYERSPSLGFKISSGTKILDTHTFKSLLKVNQKNPYVIETNLNYYIEKRGAIKIEIDNQYPERLFQISMLYTLERRNKSTRL